MVVGIAAFKSFASLWFYQGALLADPDKVLVNAQEGRTQAQRQWRFTTKKEVKATRVKHYINEAKKLVKEGKAIKPRRNKPLAVPPELKAALADNKNAQAAFDALNLTKRREYAEHIADAKRAATKASLVRAETLRSR